VADVGVSTALEKRTRNSSQKMGVRFQLIWRDFSQRVIQNFSETLNLCIMKTAASPVPADHPSKQGILRPPQNTLLGTIKNNWNLTPIN
jgi:hypothetical protein